MLEYNDYGNAARASDVRQAVEALGDAFAIWMTRNFSATEARAAVISSGAKGFIAEGEIPAYAQGSPNPQAQDWPALVDALKDLPIDKGVATSYAPFQGPDNAPMAELAKPLIDNGWHCLPYVYPAEEAGATPEGKQAYALHYTHEARPDLFVQGQGWYNIEPLLGCYAGMFGDYSDINNFQTRNSYRSCHIWAAEFIL